MPAENDLHEKSDWRQLLRRVDQVGVALLVLSALAAMAVYWFASGGHRGQLIEIDRAPPLQAVFLVNINEAAPAELTQLPGIGKELARRIVASREPLLRAKSSPILAVASSVVMSSNAASG